MKRENVIGGIVGALLGSLIGAALIVGIGQLGFVSSWSGVVMGVCAVKGYEILGGRLTRHGVVICIVIMLIMAYQGVRLDWSLALVSELGYSLGDAFGNTVGILDYYGIGDAYMKDVALVYLFTAIGAAPTIIAARRKVVEAERKVLEEVLARSQEKE